MSKILTLDRMWITVATFLSFIETRHYRYEQLLIDFDAKLGILETKVKVSSSELLGVFSLHVHGIENTRILKNKKNKKLKNGTENTKLHSKIKRNLENLLKHRTYLPKLVEEFKILDENKDCKQELFMSIPNIY